MRRKNMVPVVQPVWASRGRTSQCNRSNEAQDVMADTVKEFSKFTLPSAMSKSLSYFMSSPKIGVLCPKIFFKFPHLDMLVNCFPSHFADD